jgi:site-specific recombinase XerD
MANTPRPPGLIQRYREELQARHYARRTVATYEQWLRRFLRFHGMRHPREMGSGEVNAFLTHLAVDLQVSPSTQNQALSALLFCTGSCWTAWRPWWPACCTGEGCG